MASKSWQDYVLFHKEGYIKMNKKRIIYMFISTTMVFVYLLLYAVLYRPGIVHAQTTCFQITWETCVGCIPGCVGTTQLNGAVVAGYTPGPYGVPIYSILCFQN